LGDTNHHITVFYTTIVFRNSYRDKYNNVMFVYFTSCTNNNMNPIILTHADTDGICSGALLKKVYPQAEVFFTKPVSLLADLEFVKRKEILISDIAINKRDAKKIFDFINKKGLNVMWFDHHPLPSNIKETDIKGFNYISSDASTSENVFRYFENKVLETDKVSFVPLKPEDVWLAIYGAIGDYETETTFVKKHLLNWDMRALYFEASSLVLGIKDEKFDNYNAKRAIVNILSSGKNPSEIPGLVLSAKNVIKREFVLYELIKSNVQVFENIGYVTRIPHFGFRGPSALFSATATKKPLGLCVFTTERYIDITMRSPNKGIPLNLLAETAAEEVGGSGGGHPTAAGARIPPNTLEKFLEKINQLLSKYI